MRGAAALASLALLTGCSSIEAGTVTHKDHTGGYTTTQWVGKAPIIINHPECWLLDLREGDETGEVCVDQETWDRVNVGDYYNGGSS